MRCRGVKLFRSSPISGVVFAVLVVTGGGIAAARPHATPTPAATPTPPAEDAAVTLIARKQFLSWQAGIIDRSKYAPELLANISDDKLKTVSTNLGRLGPPVKVEYVGLMSVDNAPAAGYKGYVYHFVTQNGAVYEQLVLDPKGQVAGIVFLDKLPDQ